MHEPCFFGNEKKYVAECIDSTFVSSVGKFVGQFEEMVHNYLLQGRPPHLNKEGAGGGPGGRGGGAVACVNGTAALHLALVVAGVKPGDKVITQPLTFVATANAIRHAGAEPVFVDVDGDTLGMSPVALRAYLSSASSVTGHASRFAAVVPMHTFGNPCRIAEIAQICEEFNIPLIEDAAESIGSYYNGQHTGTFGTIGVLSFNGNKTITTGGGGMLVTRHSSLVTSLKHLTTQAKVPHPWEFSHDAVAWNYRMPNLNAALGCAQMENLGVMLASKREVAARYEAIFGSMGIPTIKEIPGAISNFWLNGIFLENRKERNEFLQYAIDRGIHCRPAWNLIPDLPMYKDFHCEEIPNARKIADTLVNLPSSAIAP